MAPRFTRASLLLVCFLGTPLLFSAPYADWSLATLGTPSTDACADDDRDGVPAIWEYYAGRDPRVADGPLPTAVATASVGGVATLTAELAAPVPGTDATVEWQVSSDLVSWATVATSVNGAPFSGAGAAGVANGRALFRDPTPGAQRFARWKIGATSAGPRALGAAPVVTLLRDDRVATLDLDYNAAHPWGQEWVVEEHGRSDAGFRVTWWPDGASPAAMKSMGGCGGCNGACGMPTEGASLAKSLVTASRRVQLQPLVNDAVYHVRVERLNALGEITSAPTELTFNGGDGARVAALRASMTYFDDFNLPEGPANPWLWNHAHTTAADPRFQQFFINAQYHAHSLIGTQTTGPYPGDKAQVAQRFRRPLAIEPGVRRRIVFDLDTPVGPRAVWYLDFNPVPVDLTGHTEFFDDDGTFGLPSGVLRLRGGGEKFSVHLIGPDGTMRQIAATYLFDSGLQSFPNVRRSYDVRLGSDGIEVYLDGRKIIDSSFGATPLPVGHYSLLWSAIGYNTSKENSPYFLVHWDNFGFDGPVVEPRTVHNYVAQIAGDDYRKAGRWEGAFPSITVPIPDATQPTAPGATAEAWLVWTYQMGEYHPFALVPGDHVLVNGVAYPLPDLLNNSSPLATRLVKWDQGHTARIKLGDIVYGGSSPLRVGDNTFQFFAENTGILNLHVEVLFPPGSEPPYTPPAALHHSPMHHELPKFGAPARIQQIGTVVLGDDNPYFDEPARVVATVAGRARATVLIGNESGTNQPLSHLVTPARSAELWATGGVAGIRKVELFLRPYGGGPETARRLSVLTTQRAAPAPQVRHGFEFDTTALPNGDYELFVLATGADGVLSHPAYLHSDFHFDASEWAGAYFPVRIRIANWHGSSDAEPNTNGHPNPDSV